MKALELRDIKDHIFLTLAEVLAALPARAQASSWEVADYVDANGASYFWVGANGDESLADLAESGKRISGAELTSLAGTSAQVIFGTLRGFDRVDATEPWIVLHAIDSSYWRCETDDITSRNALVSGFEVVRILDA